MSSMFAASITMILFSVFTNADVSITYLPVHPSSQERGPVWKGPFAMPIVLQDGTIAETAEVAAARATHLAALEAARAMDPDMGQDDGEYDPQKYGDHAYGVVAHSKDLLQSMLSYQALSKDIADPASIYGTQGSGMNNVVKAKSDSSNKGAVYEAHAMKTEGGNIGVSRPVHGAPSKTIGGSGYGALAMLQLLASGYLEDTPEVMAARNTHLKALKEAQAAAELWREKLPAAGGTQVNPWG